MLIQICHSLNGRVETRHLEVTSDATVGDALEALPTLFGVAWSTLLEKHYGVAVFGKKSKLDAALHEGDRIEICGPLIASPMDARRRRAKREHKGGKM